MLLALALIAANFHLTFARSGCYRTCPIYRTTVDAHGAVTFVGKEYAAAVGKHERTMTSGDLEKLAAAIRAIGFSS